jgi:RNA polymerase sigma factor (sigma-70 family)
MDEAVTISTLTVEGKRDILNIIKEYSGRLLGFIRKRVTIEADAEDILQDVFFQLINYTKPIDQLNGWLFAVARNKITDKQRKKDHSLIEDELLFKDDDDSKWQEIFFDESDNADNDLLRSMFWDELYHALDELPAAQREVFILHELEGIPFTIIAEQTGETVNTLLSRKRYAVLHLRKRLEVLRNEILNY